MVTILVVCITGATSSRSNPEQAATAYPQRGRVEDGTLQAQSRSKSYHRTAKDTGLFDRGRSGDSASFLNPADKMIPHYKFNRHFRITIPDMNHWREGPPITADLIWYTDGSKTNQRDEAGIYGNKPRVRIQVSGGNRTLC